MKNFSVLISLYYKENHHHVYEALRSIFNQTLPPSEVVIVKDGPLTPELDNLIKLFSLQYNAIKVIELHNNVGLGKALSIGINHCTNDVVVRMDADDICVSTRFEKQYAFLQARPDIAVVGSLLEEFKHTPGDIKSYKKVPEKHRQILRFSKFRCPINHPTVMFRKAAILDAGNYQSTFPEDYDLWIRVLAKGYQFHNLQECLLHFRRGSMVNKRMGLSYSRKEMILIYRAYQLNHLNLFEMIANLFIKVPLRLMPVPVVQAVYILLLRSKSLHLNTVKQ